MEVKELYTAHPIAANGSLTLNGVRGLGGFLASASGDVTVTIDGVEVATAVAVTAGIYTPFPASVKDEVLIELANSAAGTFFA